MADLWTEEEINGDSDEEGPSHERTGAEEGDQTRRADGEEEQSQADEQMDQDALSWLYECIQASVHWLCFVWYQEYGASIPK